MAVFRYDLQCFWAENYYKIIMSILILLFSSRGCLVLLHFLPYLGLIRMNFQISIPNHCFCLFVCLFFDSLLCCFVRLSLIAMSRDCSLIVVCRLLMVAVSCCITRVPVCGLQYCSSQTPECWVLQHSLSSCSTSSSCSTVCGIFQD